MTLKRGSKGTDVVQLQNLLGGLGAVTKERFYAQLEGESAIGDVEA